MFCLFCSVLHLLLRRQSFTCQFLILALLISDDFKYVLDGTLNLLKSNRIGFLFFKHRRFVDFAGVHELCPPPPPSPAPLTHFDAVDYLSSLSLNGTPEVVPVPCNKSASCSLDSRRKRAALDHGDDDAAAASSSPAAANDSYEGYVGLYVYFHLLEFHDACCGCGGVGGGGGHIQHHNDALQLLVDSSNMMPNFSVELKKRLLRLFLGPLLYKSLIMEPLIILGE